MTPQSAAKDIIERSLLDAMPIRDTERQDAAARALSYLTVSAQETDLTEAWSSQYHPDAQQFWIDQPKAVFDIFGAVVRKLCTLYGRPVVRSWGEGGERWEKAWARVKGFDALMQDTDEQTLVGATTFVRPLVLEDEPGGDVRHALYTADQTEYTQRATDPCEADQLVFAWENGAGDSVTTTKHYWTRELFMETVDDESTSTPEGWEEGDVPGSAKHPYGRIPVIIFRNRPARKSFFGEPATDLVLAALTLNRGLTDLAYALPAHSNPTVVARGRDTSKPLKLGLRSAVDVDVNGGGLESFTFNAPLADIIASLQFLLGLFLASRGIPEDTFMVRQQGQSGIAIVAKDASLTEWRESRINQFRPLEQDLMRLTVMVQEIHDGRPCTFDEVPVPTITYAKPKIPLSADERQEWMDKIRMGAATAIDYMLAEDPTLDEPKALEKWKANQAFNRAANAGPVFDRKMGVDDGE